MRVVWARVEGLVENQPLPNLAVIRESCPRATVLK